MNINHPPIEAVKSKITTSLKNRWITSSLLNLIVTAVTTIMAWIVLPIPILRLLIMVAPLPALVLLVIQYAIVSVPLVIVGAIEVRLWRQTMAAQVETAPSPSAPENKRFSSLASWLGFHDTHSFPILLRGIGIGLALILVPIVVISFASYVVPWLIPSGDTEIPRVLLPQTLPDLLVSVSIIFLANSLVEELFFRAYIQRTFARWIPGYAAVFFAALIFGAFHLGTSMLTAVNAFVLGIILGGFYHRTQSLYTTWIAHAVYNSFLVTISFLLLPLI